MSKKQKKQTHRKTRIVNPHLYLLAKIDRIRNRIKEVKPTGTNTDEQTGEVYFKFTEAQEVFEIYRDECIRERLIIRPYLASGIQPVTAVAGHAVLIVAPFCIEDMDTGYTLVGYGAGMGMNGDWSGNTAHTRALKQFLLTTFQATWRDPEGKHCFDILGIGGTASEMRQQLLDACGGLLNRDKKPPIKKEINDGSKNRKSASRKHVGGKAK